MKYFFRKLLTLAILLTISFSTAATVSANENINVTVNGQEVYFSDQVPIIVDGRTLVPIRDVFEAMDFIVAWDEDTSTVTLSDRWVDIVILIGQPYFAVIRDVHTPSHTETVIIPDAPAQIIGGRAMIPLRAISEAVGADVEWAAEQSLVIITTEGRPLDDDYIAMFASDIAAALQVGMSRTEAESILGVTPQRIVEAYDGRPAWRFDLLTEANYEYLSAHDSLDFEGLEAGRVRIVVFITYDVTFTADGCFAEYDTLARYSVFYAQAEGVGHIDSLGRMGIMPWH